MNAIYNIILAGIKLPTVSEDLKQILTIYYLPVLILIGIALLGLVYGIFLVILERVNPKAFKKVMNFMSKI